MVKKNAEKDAGFVQQFNELKKKHPDAVLLFRKGDFYEMYKEDALKASVILALKVSDKILPLENDPIKLLTFPRHELDKHLPKLIRSGQRVAICEAIDQPKLMKKPREKTGKELKETNTSNKNTMAKKKKEQAVQEEPTKTVKSAVEEKPAKEMKSEQATEQKAEAKQERKPREPQMITANGEKVSHGHAFQSTINPADWYFTAKIDGVQLKPQKMDAADLAAYQKKEMTVPQLMERYYPTKLMPKVSEEAYQMPKQLSGPDGAITIDKFNVYKEKDEQRPDYSKMPLVEVIARVNRIHHWTIRERLIATAFLLILAILSFVYWQIWQYGIGMILFFILLWGGGLILILWIYRKKFLNRIHEIKKNLSELNELM